VHIARATRDDIDDLAHLIRLDTPGAMTSAGTFSADLAEWWDEHQGTHHAFVAWADDSTVVGMAWLAMLPRVPRPGATNRLCADIQTVFVLPSYRRAGIGAALVEAAAQYGTGLGAGRITVHSGRRAVRLYQRLGFSTSPQLLQR